MAHRDTRYRRVIRAARDGSLRHTPGLQGLVCAAARRGHLPPALLRRLHPSGTWTLHAPDGTPFTYVSDPHDGLARHVVWTDLRDWEPGTHPLLFTLARQARAFVDVGAYSGLYTLLACLANPALRAVAVEPNPAKLPQLRANVSANDLQDRVTIVGSALSACPGRATLAVPWDDSAAALRVPRPGDRSVPVRVTTGDALLSDVPVDLIKIDVEGSEPEVLAGMARLLAARRPHIIAECLDTAAVARLCRSAATHGYPHVYHLVPDGPVPVPVSGRRAHPGRHPNYLLAAEPVTTG